MRPLYSKKVIQHFLKPKFFGKIKNPDGLGRAGNPLCGDIMELFIKVKKIKKQEIISAIKFQTLGCLAAIASSDIICEMVKGKTIEEAKEIKFKNILKKLGHLPPLKIHCSVLATEALKKAIENYQKNTKLTGDSHRNSVSGKPRK